MVNQECLNTAAVTDVIKILGEEGLAKNALMAFYRMKQLHCTPDVQCYNTIISVLCRAGDFKKARFILNQMELPGARCPPDCYTYTIFISFYCKRSMHTGCRKAIRRRMWEANHMFRHMKFRGFEPDLVTYNCLIDGLCKTYRVDRAHELFDEMVEKGCVPNKVTYNSFVRYYSVVNEVDKAMEMMKMMISRGHGLPTSSTYTPILHSLCESGRVKEAKDLMVEMVECGATPREFTYKLVCDALSTAKEAGFSAELTRRIEGDMDQRYTRVMRLKPTMSRRVLLI